MSKMRSLSAAVMGVVGAAVVGYASIPMADGTIHGCRQKSNGHLRVIDVGAGETCQPNSELPIAWNVLGPKGDRGDKGDKGDTGATGATGPAGPAGPAASGYSAGAGLDLSEGSLPGGVEFRVFQISRSHRLPQGCAPGQIAQKEASGPGWVCGSGGSSASGQAFMARGNSDLQNNEEKVVASLELAAGSYLITGRGDLISRDLDEQPAHCTLMTGFGTPEQTELDVSTTWLHEGGEPVWQPINVMTAVTFPDPTTVDLLCATYAGHGAGVLTALAVAGVN